MNNLKFRPIEYPLWWKIKHHRRGHWFSVLKPFHDDRKLFRDWKTKTFMKLHYLGIHSVSGSKKWQYVEINFLKRYRRSGENF